MKKTLITIFTITLLFFKTSEVHAIGSEGVAALSALGMTYSAVLYNGASQQQKDSSNNIDKIDTLIKSFKDSYVNLCPNGRDSLNEPKCYCYLDTGKPNLNRSNSQTCTALWASDQFKAVATAGDYSSTPAIPPVGCVTLAGKFDENCTCKKFVDPKGNNSCMKTTSIAIPSGFGSGFATGAGLQQLVQTSNNAANGNPQLGLISSAQLNNAAIKSKKMQDQVITQLASKLPPNMLALTKMNDGNVNRYAKAILGEKALNAAAAKGGGSPLSIASTRKVDPKTEEMLKAAEKKAGLDLVGSGKGLANKKVDGKEMNFNFGADQSNSAAPAAQDFPDAGKNYNYKNSDITKNSDSSIFDIISNRYIQSGLKRLFEN